LLATVAIVAPSSFTARMNSTVQTDEAGNTVVEDSARGVINALALRMIERAPVLGHGTGAFERESAHVIGLPFVVHNAPLRVAVSYGVPLAILFLMIYVTPLFRAVQLMLIPNDVPPVMVAALVGGTVTVLAFIQTNPRLFRVLYIFIGMLLTLLYQRAVATKRARGARPDGTTTAAERGPIASASASAALPGRG
jgi:O-antigen ligase